MPNHVLQKLVMKAADPANIKAVHDLVYEKKKQEDGTEVEGFNVDAFFPMPPELKSIHTGANTINGQRVHRWIEDDEGNAMELTEEKLFDLKIKYGATDWYEWAMKNWGTKWGVYGVKWRGTSEIWFESAWTPATLIVEKLSSLFPKVRFNLAFADECGNFVGRTYFSDGKRFLTEDYEWDSEDGMAVREDVFA